jgi:CRP-like cAMP-binding protein
MKKHTELMDEEVDLAQFGFFQTLNENELNMLSYEQSCSIYKKGSVVYREGNWLNGIYCVTSGILKQYKKGIDGKHQILRFIKKGDMIGYRSLLSKEPACSTVAVIEDAVLCQIPQKNLLYMLENNTHFAMGLLRTVCKELKEANDYITDIAQKTVRERVAEVLLLLKENFDLDKTQTLRISLTREELSQIVGTATESVIRVLSDFKKDNLIEVKGRKIKIIDIPGLTEIANLY